MITLSHLLSYLEKKILLTLKVNQKLMRISLKYKKSQGMIQYFTQSLVFLSKLNPEIIFLNKPQNLLRAIYRNLKINIEELERIL